MQGLLLHTSTCTTHKNKLHGFRYDKCGGHNWTGDQKMVSQCVTHSCWFTVLQGEGGGAIVIIALIAHHMPTFVPRNTTSWTITGISADQNMLFWASTYPLKWLQRRSMGSISPSCTIWRFCCFMICFTEICANVADTPVGCARWTSDIPGNVFNLKPIPSSLFLC